MEMIENRMISDVDIHYETDEEYEERMNALAERDDERWENGDE